MKFSEFEAYVNNNVKGDPIYLNASEAQTLLRSIIEEINAAFERGQKHPKYLIKLG